MPPQEQSGSCQQLTLVPFASACDEPQTRAFHSSILPRRRLRTRHPGIIANTFPDGTQPGPGAVHLRLGTPKVRSSAKPTPISHQILEDFSFAHPHLTHQLRRRSISTPKDSGHAREPYARCAFNSGRCSTVHQGQSRVPQRATEISKCDWAVRITDLLPDWHPPSPYVHTLSGSSGVSQPDALESWVSLESAANDR